MEPSQRSSCSTLSMVTSWTTSRSLYRYTKHRGVSLTNVPLQTRVSEFVSSFHFRELNWLRGRYTQLASRQMPCLKFLPGSSFTKLLWYLWKCTILTSGIQCWHDFYINHIYCFVTLQRESKDVFRKQLHLVACVNKWSPPSRSCLCDYSHAAASSSIYTEMWGKTPQKCPKRSTLGVYLALYTHNCPDTC